MEQTKTQFKLLPVTMLIVIPIFAWLSVFVNDLPSTVFSTPWNFNAELTRRHTSSPVWIFVYTTVSIPFGQILSPHVALLLVQEALGQAGGAGGMRITISGPIGSGKTTVCNLLSERTGMPYVVSGHIFRQMAKEHGLSLAEFGRLAEKEPRFDIELDQRMVRLAEEKEDIILEGRLVAQMLTRHRIPALRVLSGRLARCSGGPSGGT